MKRLLCLSLILCLLLGGCFFARPTDPVYVPPEGQVLRVHFIDVGQADCALLECDGKYMLIDGGNVDDSSRVVSYLQKQGVEKLETVVCTHAHEDHVGGLAGVLAVFPTDAVYCSTRTYNTKCFDDFMRYADQQDLIVQIPQPGDTMELGDADITVLGPVRNYEDPNNMSIVLMVQFGENKFLFTGDMEWDAESDLLNRGTNVKADVLKVGHHGSYTSTSYRFLYEVDPTYAVISVGKGNSYGHPHEEPMSRLQDADVIIYRTDEMGAIIAVSDGKNIAFSWEKGAGPALPGNPETGYIGNKNSKIVHTDRCSSLPKAESRVVFDDLDDAIAQGYTPCGNCIG